MVMVDSKGILSRERMEDVKRDENKRNMCEKTNKEGRKGGIKEAMRDTDLCIALSTPGPGVIKKEWVADMADDAIVFACANPVPEIWPVEAEEGGARIVATGRSDFNNQVNNSLGFPAVFRGALDVRAARITDEMCIAAADAIARYTEEDGKGKEKGISESRIIPRMEESEMYVCEAVAVGMKAIEQGVAEKRMSMKSLEERVREKISDKTTKPF
jgi:malate dehydrogenase (oxaloacetate-decarboxylating)